MSDSRVPTTNDFYANREAILALISRDHNLGGIANWEIVRQTGLATSTVEHLRYLMDDRAVTRRRMGQGYMYRLKK